METSIVLTQGQLDELIEAVRKELRPTSDADYQRGRADAAKAILEHRDRWLPDDGQLATTRATLRRWLATAARVAGGPPPQEELQKAMEDLVHGLKEIGATVSASSMVSQAPRRGEKLPCSLTDPHGQHPFPMPAGEDGFLYCPGVSGTVVAAGETICGGPVGHPEHGAAWGWCDGRGGGRVDLPGPDAPPAAQDED
jgi:hypothetical protein